MHEFVTRELHLAAYAKTHGAELLGVSNGAFRLRSDRSEQEWRVAHSNSCCRRVDQELIALRKFLKPRG